METGRGPSEPKQKENQEWPDKFVYSQDQGRVEEHARGECRVSGDET